MRSPVAVPRIVSSAVSSVVVLALAGCPAAPPAEGQAAKAEKGEAKGKGKAEDGQEKDAPAAAASGTPVSAQPVTPEGGEVTVDGFTWTLPRGLSKPPAVPADNPMSTAKVKLGHALFMDKRLSVDGSRSCYSCHQNELGNADGRALALGAGDKPLTRNTPTIWNVAYHEALYWDGRAASLEAQALGAWKGGNMGVGEEGLAAKAAEVGALEEYAAQFREVFALKEGDAVTPNHVAQALSAYERTLLCGDTTYDKGTLSDAQLRGWDLFRGKAQCTACHNGENFSDGLYHGVGIGYDDKGAPIGTEDVGRGKPANDPAMNGKFRTPTLRNVAKTAPYFHDGSAKTLRDAVTTMASGGNPVAPGWDALLTNKGLTDAEIDDVVAFLEALNCPGQLEVIGDQTVAGIPEVAAAEPAAPAPG
jgi:cytochrome c peroxidase